MIGPAKLLGSAVSGQLRRYALTYVRDSNLGYRRHYDFTVAHCYCGQICRRSSTGIVKRIFCLLHFASSLCHARTERHPRWRQRRLRWSVSVSALGDLFWLGRLALLQRGPTRITDRWIGFAERELVTKRGRDYPDASGLTGEPG